MKKLFVTIVIFLTIFIIISLSFTYLMINLKVNQYSDNSISPTNLNKKVLSSDINTDNFFYKNNVEVVSKTISIGEENIEIPQVSGLSDKKVENKINQSIYDKLINVINNYKEYYENSPMKNDFSFGCKYKEQANFSNIISIEFQVYNEMQDSIFLYQNITCLNYELINGNELKIEDIFTDDADVPQIIRHAVYKTLSDKYFSDLGNSWDLWENWDSDSLAYADENELYKIVNGILKDTNFSVSTGYVFIYYDNWCYRIQLSEIGKYVAVYDRFNTGEKYGAGMFYFSIAQYVDYGLIEDNLWVDCANGSRYNIEQDEFYYNLKKDNEQKVIEKYRKLAKENPDRFYILSYATSFETYSDQKKYVTMICILTSCDVTLDSYNEIYKNQLMEKYRSGYASQFGIRLYDWSPDDCNYEENIEYELYDSERKEKINDLSDVFVDGFDYMKRA